MPNSKSKCRIATFHAKEPKNIEDIHQQSAVVSSINPDFICGDFNIPLEKYTYYKNLLGNLTDSLCQYTLVNVGSPTSYKNRDMAGPISNTRKSRGYDTPQWLKIGNESESRKDYIGVLSDSYTVESKGQFPPLEKLNTSEWFADHQFIWCVCKDVKTLSRIFIASFNKVPTWRYSEWLKDDDIKAFGLSDMYYPSKDTDSMFIDLIKIVYPKSQELEITQWQMLIDLYSDSKEFGMQYNEYVSDTNKPDDREWNKYKGKLYTYPSVNYGKYGVNYYCWTWEEFKDFLEIDWKEPSHYTMKPFKEWSNLWFNYTKMTEPFKGCGTYNNPSQLKTDTGINLGIRLYQYMMSYYTLYMLNNTEVVKNNPDGLSMNLKYKRAFIEIYGTLDEDGEPNNDVPIEYNIECQRNFLKDKIVNTITPYIEECDEAYICMQEDWEFNSELESEFNTLDTITSKFIIQHQTDTNTPYNIDTSILSFIGRHTKCSVEPYSYSNILPEGIDRLERESVDSKGNYIISTMEKKNTILKYNDTTTDMDQIDSFEKLYTYGVFKPLGYIISSLYILSFGK